MLLKIGISTEKNKSQSRETARETLLYVVGTSCRIFFFSKSREFNSDKASRSNGLMVCERAARDVRCKGIRLIGRIATQSISARFHFTCPLLASRGYLLLWRCISDACKRERREREKEREEGIQLIHIRARFESYLRYAVNAPSSRCLSARELSFTASVISGPRIGSAVFPQISPSISSHPLSRLFRIYDSEKKVAE